uniref:Arylamine N-acetyltransferase n=1 Tax=Strigamia maritima TaxID=126957 RepID=T1IS99_STRMM
MTDTILSKESAFKFLEEILKIQNPESERTKSSKLHFLIKIISNWYNNIPFQNIDQLCLTKREQRLPTVPEIINFHLQGRGGVCLYNAIF